MLSCKYWVLFLFRVVRACGYKLQLLCYSYCCGASSLYECHRYVNTILIYHSATRHVRDVCSTCILLTERCLEIARANITV